MKTIVLFTTILLLMAGCKPPQQGKVTPERAAEIRAAIIDWMECEECEEGQLQNLARQGEAVVPSLAAILEQGPSAAKAEAYRIHLEDSYRALVDYQKTHPDNKVSISEEEYLKTYLSNYDALYKSRAAAALSEIGGKEARQALEDVLKKPLRPDVIAAVQDALRKIK